MSEIFSNYFRINFRTSKRLSHRDLREEPFTTWWIWKSHYSQITMFQEVKSSFLYIGIELNHETKIATVLIKNFCRNLLCFSFSRPFVYRRYLFVASVHHSHVKHFVTANNFIAWHRFYDVLWREHLSVSVSCVLYFNRWWSSQKYECFLFHSLFIAKLYIWSEICGF